MNVKKKTISVELAKSRIKRFRDALTEYLPDSEIPRAVFIPIEDILAIADKYRLSHETSKSHKHKISGVRAYLAITERPSEVAKQNEVIALMVPVSHDGKDIVQDNLNDADDTEIYDFTKPCPTSCDESSPLFVQ